MLTLLLRFFRNSAQRYWNVRARIQFGVRRVRWPNNLSVLGPLGLSANGKIEIGENVTIVNDTKYNRAGINHPTQLVAAAGGHLRIGNHVGISGASIFCVKSIEIGNYVLIGASCRIYDTDFHPINYRDRRESKKAASAEVVIQDDVWLGANVTVLKGVTIGARSIIASGSVVTRDIPADTLAGGIPAKPIRMLSKQVQNKE